MSTSALAQNPPPSPTPEPAPPPTATDERSPAPASDTAPAPTPPPAPLATPPPPPLATVTTPTALPAMNGRYLRLGDLFTIRPGFLLQVWASAAQDAVPKANGDAGDFARNIYIRRGRLFFGGEVATPDLTYFVLWESANDGQPALAGTAVSKFTVFQFNDAFLDYRISKNVSVQAGLMLVPVTRNIIQASTSYWSLDIGGVSATNLAALQTQTLRDTGVQVKIDAVDNHLEVRAMASGGVRLPDVGAGHAPGKNDPRLTGFVQYNFLDGEPPAYVFNGQYFGRKAIAALAFGVDYQDLVGTNPYFANSATAVAAIPIHGADAKNGGDEVGGQVELLHFHNGRIPGNPLDKQNDLYVEGGYYNRNGHFSVFGKYEGRFFDDTAAEVNNYNLFGGGLKYFLAESYANITFQYSLQQFPKAAPMTRNDVNLFQVQLLLSYF